VLQKRSIPYLSLTCYPEIVFMFPEVMRIPHRFEQKILSLEFYSYLPAKWSLSYEKGR